METSNGGNGIFLSISPLKALHLHLICGFVLVTPFLFAHHIYSINLTTHPSQMLFLIWGFVAPVVIIVFSHLRQDRKQCSYIQAVGRGFLGLLTGAIVNALGAIILGAPVSFEYFPKTLNWSLLMSSFTFVPAACAFGSLWTNWHSIFAETKAFRFVDCMVRIPACGAVIGAWFGAWPMPLDWERPWQEWPICVTYGATAGYLVGLVTSLVCIICCSRQQRLKGE
ncbi:uncharacterized protein LOC129894896 [Solanum dulcamara]|uniref:uncharacterized protein LOC129894896 n=1 Tax=Solanum dulcamara TaxID=45834 RepID=UPI0024866DD6|nr:uncharacterized protein LOC129894896 [Solanum dulcamara]